jgi:hypothetical protein
MTWWNPAAHASAEVPRYQLVCETRGAVLS